MRRVILSLIALTMLAFTGWGIMFTRGGQNPFPAATPTPSSGTTIDQCAANLGTGIDLPLTLTVATNTDGSTEGLLLLHKGVTTGTDPNQMVLTSMDSFNNTWYNDIAQTNGVNKASAGCLNADWVPVSSGTGSDTVTAKSPGTGLFNAAVLCTVKNFAAYDVSSGNPYSPTPPATTTNALTGVVSPDVPASLQVAAYYIEAASPAFSNLSANSTIAPNTPTDLGFTTSSISFNASQLLGAVNEAGTLNTSLGFQRGFTPAGNFCGGIIALTNAISSLTIAPTNPTVVAGGTQQFTATAVLPSGGTQNVLTGSITWTSSNTSVATISNKGLATVSSSAAANSTTTITATYKGKTATTVLTVTVASAGTFPHLSNTGQILTTYTAGSSTWLRSMFFGTFGNAPLADYQAAGLNSIEDGTGFPYAGFFPGSSGCGTGTGFVLSCYHQWWENNVWPTLLSQFNASGMPYFENGDQALLWYNKLNFQDGDLTWGSPFAVDNSVSMFNQGSPLHMFVGSVFHDEFPSANFGPCTDPSGNALEAFGMGYQGDPFCGNGTFTPTVAGLSSAPFPHIAMSVEVLNGSLTNTTTRNEWYGTPTISDFAAVEDGGGGTIENALGIDRSSDADLANAFTIRGKAWPAIMSAISCDGPFYFKDSNNTQFTPGSDTLVADQASSPGAVVATMLFGVAHGYVGERVYGVDANFASGRKNDTPGTGSSAPQEQTGCSPLSGWTNGVNGIPEIGQDRWYAMSAANNVIKAVESFGVLDAPQMTPPLGCNAFVNYVETNTGSSIVCGARQATGARLVVFANASSNSNSISYDPSAYVFAGGTAASWKIVASNSRACGVQTTNPAASDCGIGGTAVTGATTVNPWMPVGGVNPVLPAAGLAPTTPVTLNMQPTEVDVFLYHP